MNRLKGMNCNLAQVIRYCIVVAFLIAIFGMVLTSCGSSGVVQGIKKESLYDRVLRTGKIRAAYAVYYPVCIKDSNSGKLSGIGVEALELVAKKLGLTVEFNEEVGWGNMIEGLRADRYDIMASTAWPVSSRAKLIAFTRPLFYSPVYVYAKKGDNRFNGHLENINSKKVTVSTVDGEAAQVIADADFPQARRLSMPQMTDIAQTFLNLTTKKADVAIADPVFAAKYLQNNPGTIQNISGTKPIRVFPNCWIFNRGEFEFKAMIDTVLEEVINSGAMDKIIEKYEPAPNLIYRAALPYQLPK
jgi:ABC-type amino acid transport substrate-binding protein